MLDFLTRNWVLILVVGGMGFMHFGMHGSHGKSGHAGGHVQGRDQDNADGIEGSSAGGVQDSPASSVTSVKTEDSPRKRGCC
ncbi:MAG: hypothetical protein ABI899_05655 [Actinomycetota bacterium]